MTGDASLNTMLLDRFRVERRDAHTRVLALAADLTDDQLSWRPGPHALGIGFHVWHLARWEDYDGSFIQGAPQIWVDQDLARVWGFASAPLGEEDTGTQMGDDASERLVLPGREPLLKYARSAFDAMDAAIGRLPKQSMLEPANDPQNHDRIGLLFDGLTHLNRHLGMVEALRGLLDLPGTATR